MTGETPHSKSLVEPPEGALAGESVPRENTLTERQQAAVRRLAHRLKALDGYADLDAEERRRLARKKLRREGVIA